MSDQIITLLIFIFIICEGALCAYIARRKNYEPWIWGLGSVFGGPLILLVLLLIPKHKIIKQQTDMVAKAEPNGLSGWLILPVIGLFFTPLLIGYALATSFWPIFANGYWAVLTTPGSKAYNSLWAPLISFEIIGNVLLLLASLILLYLLFSKSFHLPKLMAVFLLANLLFVTADYFLAGNIGMITQHAKDDAMNEIIRSTIAALIWIPYFLVSKRVKNTFVRKETAQLNPAA